MIDKSLQKDFVSCSNGVMEHILSVNSLLENANLILATTFLDLCIWLHLTPTVARYTTISKVPNYIENIYWNIQTFFH